MGKTKELIATFEELWQIALNGDYRNSQNISCLARTIEEEVSKPHFNQNNLSLTEQITLRHALILANVTM